MVDEIQVAVQIAPHKSREYGGIRDTVRRCEDMGVDIVFNWDHFFPMDDGGPYDPDGPNFECWTMLAAWAEQTSRIEFGPLVTCSSYRNPDLLADMARTVDHIAGGRLILGIGSGWTQREYDEYGYEFGTAGSRLDDLGASLQRIKGRLSKLNPPPTREIPILIGGSGEKKLLRLVAEHADIWQLFLVKGPYARKASVLAQHCEAVGRDPSTIRHMVGLSAPSDRLGAQAQELADLGVTMFNVRTSGPDYDLTRIETLCRWRDSL